MATFELARLYGGRDVIHFEATNDEKISVWFHHAQQEEIAVALDAAGLELDKDSSTVPKGGGGVLVTSVMLRQASVELACLCIESIENFDGWHEPSRERGSSGLQTMTTANRDVIPRIVLRSVGDRIFELANIGDDEGKDSGPSPISDT